MPVDLEWHSSLPVLIATYRGTLSAKDYDKMCDERSKMLKGAPSHVILVADTRQMQSFPEAEAAERRESVMLHAKITHTLVVLNMGLYQRLSRSIIADQDYSFPVSFFSDADRALVEAQILARRL